MVWLEPNSNYEGSSLQGSINSMQSSSVVPWLPPSRLHALLLSFWFLEFYCGFFSPPPQSSIVSSCGKIFTCKISLPLAIFIIDNMSEAFACWEVDCRFRASDPSLAIEEAGEDRMANKHCYMHNVVVSGDMDGVKDHVHACDVGPRWQHRKRDKHSYKGCLKVHFPNMGHFPNMSFCNIPKVTWATRVFVPAKEHVQYS